MRSNNNVLIAQGGGTNKCNKSIISGNNKRRKKFNSKIIGAYNGVSGIVNNRFINLSNIKEET